MPVVTLPRFARVEPRLERHAHLVAAVRVRRQLDHGVQRNGQIRAALARNALEIRIERAQHCVVGDDQHRVARALELYDDRVEAQDNVLVRLAARIAVVELVALAPRTLRADAPGSARGSCCRRCRRRSRRARATPRACDRAAWRSVPRAGVSLSRSPRRCDPGSAGRGTRRATGRSGGRRASSRDRRRANRRHCTRSRRGG